MSRFNKKITTRTENLAGGKAYKESSKLEFASVLLTSFVQNQYYRSSDDTIKRMKELIEGFKDKLFCAKASIYARTKFGMRSITHIVSSIVAKLVKGEKWTKNYFDKVIYRVDDITETLSYYFNNYGKPLPNSLKKGLAKSFDKFDEYQLAKYRAEGKDISLVDAVNLLHPKAVEKNKEALEKLIKGELKSIDTWELKLTQAGQKAETQEEKEQYKKDAWVSLIKERKIGYFALLRNLRNIIEQAPEIVDEACNMLTDEKLIKKSLVLPFRFATAYEEILNNNSTEARKVLMAISKAVDISLNNIPNLSGNSLVVCDYSGSMGKGLNSNRGKGTLFGICLAKKLNADFMIFGDTACYINFNPADSTLTIVNATNKLNDGWGNSEKNGDVGHGTNFHAIFVNANKKYDRIFIFSDMQGWMGYNTPVSTFNSYKKKYECNPYIYSIDLSGYGTLQFPENKVFCLAGFSDKIFDIMEILEVDKNALINEIEKIEI